MKNKTIKAALLFLFTMISVFAGSPSVSTNGAMYSLDWNDGSRIESSTFAVRVNGDWIYGDSFPNKKWSVKKGEYTLTCSGLSPVESVKLSIKTETDGPYVVISAAVTASEPFELGGVRVLTRENEAHNFLLGKNWAQWNAFVEHLHGPKTGRIYWLDQMESLKTDKKGDDLRDGFWVSTLQNDSTNMAFAMAALKGELWPTVFEWRNVKEGNLHLSISSRSPRGLEKVLVRAGASVETDPVLVGFWDDRRPTKVLAELGRIMGESVREGRPMRRVEPGWSTWHSYHRTMTADDMVKTAHMMRNELYDAGYRYLQLDGGWWITQGSYIVNDQFPRGIREIANGITDTGMKFGLHISPLRVNPAEPFWRNHEDWIVTPYGKDPIDPDDQEMITTIGAVYLDGSHPDVPTFLAGQFKQMVEGYQPTFMKWDHHYGGLEEADRYDPTMTGLQAHNKAIRAIRAALPEDLVVTRSMGWIYGAIECYDAMRIGNDINHPGIVSEEEPYAKMTYGKTTGTIRDVLEGKEYKGLIRFARQAAQNYYIHNNIVICDPDAFFVTPQYTMDEARVHITIQALMGGLLFCGDRIDSLPPDRLALLKHEPLLDVWRNHKHAIPLDLFSGVDIPRIWKLELEDRIVFGFFNWLDDASKTSWTLADLELSADSYRLKDLWSGKSLKLNNGGLTLDMVPHSVRLIEFRK